MCKQLLGVASSEGDEVNEDVHSVAERRTQRLVVLAIELHDPSLVAKLIRNRPFATTRDCDVPSAIDQTGGERSTGLP